MSLLIANARVLTLTSPACDPASPQAGLQLGTLGVIPAADVHVSSGRITAVVPAGSRGSATAAPAGVRRIDARGRVLLPGFVDCHTHACWAGDRLDEWDQRRAGTSYLDILKAGGGIMSTVRAVRRASEHELTDLLLDRLMVMLSEGSTTIEVKSGYGLTPADELKMLRSIAAAAARFPGTVVPTALLGHALDPDQVRSRGEDGCADWMTTEALPAVTREFPGIAVDAYCETGAWSLSACTRLFEAARTAGHPLRVHADQFNRLGMVQTAVALGALSVDHLEASGDDELFALAASASTFGVVLPICGLHVDDRYAPARRLLDAAPTSRLAIATNYNPGSAPSPSMPLAIALAVRKCGLTPAQAVAAATINPARLLGFTDRGVLRPGARADLVLLRHTDERMLAYELGGPHADVVICGGTVVHQRRPD